MLLIDYIESCNLEACNEIDKFKLLCFYKYKEDRISVFKISDIIGLFTEAGFSKPNVSRLKTKLVTDKKMKINFKKGEAEFTLHTLQSYDRQLSSLWEDTETIKSDSELIDEIKFCGKRGYLTKLIKQINLSFKNNCYDACAVLMRRLFEVLLILTYQEAGIEDAIKRNDGYVMLADIVKDAKNNQILKFSKRIKENFDNFREVGNNSAHSITYTAGQKDINDIKIDYRVMLEDLYNRAKLIT